MKHLFLIIFTALVTFGMAQESDATYQMIHKTFTLNEDGSYKMKYHHKLKYHTYLSFHRKYGETFVIYDPHYQEINVLKSQTTMADGKVINAPDNAYNEVLPRYAMGSGEYNDLREYVITHTGLERGAVVDLIYEKTSGKTPLGVFAGSETLRYSSSVKELKLTFRIPASRELKFAGIEGEKVYNETDKYKVYTFTYKNLPALPKLRNASGMEKYVLIYNEGKRLPDQLMAIVKSEALPAKYSTVKYSEVDETNLEEVMKIHRSIAKDMKTVSVPLQFQHFPVTDVHAIDLKHSGTPIEKALYLKQRLLENNFAARIVFSIPQEQFFPNTSSIQNIKDVYVMVYTKNSDPILLSPYQIPAANPLFINYDMAMVAVDADGKLIRLAPKTTNFGDITFFLSLGKDFYEAQYDGQVNGALAGWPGSNLKTSQLFTDYWQEIEEDLVIKGPASVEISGRFKAKHLQHGNILEAQLPVLKNGIHEMLEGPFPLKGSYVLDFGYPVNETYTYRITKDEAFDLISIPKEFTEETEQFLVKTTIEETEKELIITNQVHLKSAIIPASEYQKFLKAVKHIIQEPTKRIMAQF